MGDAYAGDTVVAQSGSLGETCPHIDHIWNNGVPVEILRALHGSLEGLVVIMRHILAGVPGVFSRELRNKRTNRNHIRLLVPHRRNVALHPFGVQLFHILVLSYVVGFGHLILLLLFIKSEYLNLPADFLQPAFDCTLAFQTVSFQRDTLGGWKKR